MLEDVITTRQQCKLNIFYILVQGVQLKTVPAMEPTNPLYNEYNLYCTGIPYCETARRRAGGIIAASTDAILTSAQFRVKAKLYLASLKTLSVIEVIE